MTGADASRLMREALESLEKRSVALDYLAGMLVDDSTRVRPALRHVPRRYQRDAPRTGRGWNDARAVRSRSDSRVHHALRLGAGHPASPPRPGLRRELADDLVAGALDHPVLELYTHGLYSDDRLLVAAKKRWAGTAARARTREGTTRHRHMSACAPPPRRERLSRCAHSSSRSAPEVMSTPTSPLHHGFSGRGMRSPLSRPASTEKTSSDVASGSNPWATRCTMKCEH